MSKAIVYALFGAGKAREVNCFDFDSYLRGLLINIRMNRLIFPGWDIILQTDLSTNNAWQPLLERLPITVEVNPDNTPLTKAMLWRLKPCFNQNLTHVLCRDLDSPPTYRERQAVEDWIKSDKCAHAITDSVSHDVPMLGGMVGFRPKYFTERMGNSWQEMMNRCSDIEFGRKGADQEFLTRFVYPTVAKHGNDSITQHYFNGMPNSFLSDYHTCTCPPPSGHALYCHNNTVIDLPEELRASNTVCGHIGASGYYETAMFKFLREYWDRFDDLLIIERDYPSTFYWAK